MQLIGIVSLSRLAGGRVHGDIQDQQIVKRFASEA